MLYDVKLSPESIRALADWMDPSGAAVELVIDDSMLLAEQGDDRMAWDSDGSPATAIYLENAPLDPRPAPLVLTAGEQRATLRALELSELWYDAIAEREGFEVDGASKAALKAAAAKIEAVQVAS